MNEGATIAKFERPEARVAPTFSLQPTNLSEAMKLADLMAKSDLVPKDFKDKPGNVLIAVQMGAEIGLPPMQAIQNIAVVNGRPTIWGDAALAIVKASSAYEWITEKVDAGVATCTVKRRNEPDPIVRTFSEADAKTAGLFGKQGPWTQYPKRMLQLRARAFALRDAFPDVLKGLGVREEVADYDVVTVMPPQVDPLPAAPLQASIDPNPLEQDFKGKIAAAETELELEALRAEMKEAFAGAVPPALISDWKARVKGTFGQ